MRSKSVELQSGGSFDIPAYFPNPQTGPHGELLRELLTQNELETVTGIVVNIEDIEYVKDQLQLGTPRLGGDGPGNEMSDIAFIIIPDFSRLFGVPTNREPETIFGLNVLPQVISDRFEEADAETGEIGRHMKMMGLYPELGSEETIENIFHYQIEEDSDVIGPPIIPVNSKVDFEQQLIGQREIFKTSFLTSENESSFSEVDLMHTLALDPAIFDSNRQERERKVVAALTEPEPDFIGIKLTDFSIQARQANQSLLRVIKSIRTKSGAEIFLLNVREFGLVSFLYGADVISTPIASSPYFRMSEGQPPRLGNYYHKEDMEEYSRDDLMMKRSIRRNNYRLPCNCESCSSQRLIHQLNEDEWNDNRRRHFIFTKESEVRQLRDTSKPLDKALQDKFGRSERPEYTVYLD